MALSLTQAHTLLAMETPKEYMAQLATLSQALRKAKPTEGTGKSKERREARDEVDRLLSQLRAGLEPEEAVSG